MPTIRQISAWKEGTKRLKAYRFKRQNLSVHERLDYMEKCFMGFLFLVSLLAGVTVYLLITK